MIGFRLACIPTSCFAYLMFVNRQYAVVAYISNSFLLFSLSYFRLADLIDNNVPLPFELSLYRIFRWIRITTTKKDASLLPQKKKKNLYFFDFFIFAGMDLGKAFVVVEASQKVPTVILTSADALLLSGRPGMLASSCKATVASTSR